MKKCCWITMLFLFLFLLTSCKEAPKYDYESHGFSTNEIGTYADSPDGKGLYLFPQLGGYDPLLYYWDLEKDEYTVLCGKADCEHNTIDCNAYFSRVVNYTLQLHNEKLYVWAMKENYSFGFYQIDLDGSNRKEVCAISYTMGVPSQCVIYGDDCYVVVHDGQTAEAMTICRLYKVSMTSDAEPELICESDTNGHWIYDEITDCYAHDGNLYFRRFRLRGDERYSRFYRYDMKTEKLDVIYEGTNVDSCIMAEDKIYASILLNPEDSWEIMQYEVHCINPEDGTTEKVFGPGGRYLTYDGTYLYACAFDCIYVYDLDGTLVDAFECTIETKDGTNPYTTQNYICFCRMEIGAMEYAAYDKRDIGKEEHRGWSWYYDFGWSSSETPEVIDY